MRDAHQQHPDALGQGDDLVATQGADLEGLDPQGGALPEGLEQDLANRGGGRLIRRTLGGGNHLIPREEFHVGHRLIRAVDSHRLQREALLYEDRPGIRRGQIGAGLLRLLLGDSRDGEGDEEADG